MFQLFKKLFSITFLVMKMLLKVCSNISGRKVGSKIAATNSLERFVRAVYGLKKLKPERHTNTEKMQKKDIFYPII